MQGQYRQPAFACVAIIGFIGLLAFSGTVRATRADSIGLACTGDGPSIHLIVNNVKKSTGAIVVDLHGDKPEEFLKKIVRRVKVPARIGETRLCLPVDRPGWYAIALYHDRNSNDKLDKSWFGIPSERVGISLNPKFRMRSPRYEEAAFEVPRDGVKIVITLRKAL